MRRTNKAWSDEDIKRLLELVSKRASPYRASVVLKRSTASVQAKAREFGQSFPPRRPAWPGIGTR